MTLSRRLILKRVLTTGVYVTPVVLSVTSVIEPAAAVTPPGIIGGTMPASVTFLPLRVQYTGQGSGFPPNQAFLFLLAGPDGSVLSQSVIRTDATGATTISVNPGNFTIGGQAAPAMINGPYAFVFLADTGGTNLDATGTAAAGGTVGAQTAAAGATNAAMGTVPGSGPSTRPSGTVIAPPSQVTQTANAGATHAAQTETAIAAAQTAAAKTATAGSVQTASAGRATQVAQTAAAIAATQTAAAITPGNEATAAALTATAATQTAATQFPPVIPQPPTHH